MNRGQHHKRLAWVTGIGLGIATLAGIAGVALPRGETLWHMIAAPDVDGSWKFVSIDGIDVSKEGYSLGIRWSEIVGYSDGCNSCGIAASSEGIYHSRTCTLAACAEQPNERFFRRFISGDVRMRAEGDRLTLTVPGHRALLVRSRPD